VDEIVLVAVFCSDFSRFVWISAVPASTALQ